MLPGVEPAPDRRRGAREVAASQQQRRLRHGGAAGAASEGRPSSRRLGQHMDQNREPFFLCLVAAGQKGDLEAQRRDEVGGDLEGLPRFAAGPEAQRGLDEAHAAHGEGAAFAAVSGARTLFEKSTQIEPRCRAAPLFLFSFSKKRKGKKK